jgi:hypothetical protein
LLLFVGIRILGKLLLLVLVPAARHLHLLLHLFVRCKVLGTPITSRRECKRLVFVPGRSLIYRAVRRRILVHPTSLHLIARVLRLLLLLLLLLPKLLLLSKLLLLPKLLLLRKLLLPKLLLLLLLLMVLLMLWW